MTHDQRGAESAVRAGKRLRLRRWLCRAATAAMALQIAVSLVWTARNFNAVPGFGDTTEYVNLSKTLALDEYRPVLYPLLLRAARRLCGERFHCLIYLLQTGLCLFCMSVAVYVVDGLAHGRERGRLARSLFGGLYLTSIPMITFMNLTILTDSIANSLLTLLLALGISMVYGDTFSPWKCAFLALCLLGQTLIRADRLYSGLALLVILFAMAISGIRDGAKGCCWE